MPTTIKYKGSTIAELGAGEIGVVSCADTEMEEDIIVIAPESESGTDNALPIEVSTEAEMTALLESGEVGGVYRYTGETTETYENGAMYVLENPFIGTWKISTTYTPDSTWTLEGDISGRIYTGSTIIEYSYNNIALSGSTLSLIDSASGNRVVLQRGGTVSIYRYNGASSTNKSASVWAVLSQFTINSVSTTDADTLEAALAWLQANATKQ